MGKGDAERIRKILRERHLDEKDKIWLCQSVRTHGADDYCLDIARDFVSRAKQALDVVPDSEYRKSLTELCDYIVARDK
jgi:geranylgeranyl pyrophosphate synthase